MNERTFENGDGTFRPVPLLTLVAASNEWPNGEDGQKELGAMFDRFLFRKKVIPIRSAAGRKRLLWTDDHMPKFSQHINRDEVAEAITAAAVLPFEDDAKTCFSYILEALGKEGIHPGDRRQFKSVGACRAYAYLCGSDRVLSEHLAILAHTLWDDPSEQPEKCARVVLGLATPEAEEANKLLMQVEDIVTKSPPIEAISKIQVMQKEVKKAKAGPYNDKVLKYITAHLADLRDKIVGGD